MFDHVSIGVRDIAKAKAFYDAALNPLGFECKSAGDSSLGYGDKTIGLWILAASVRFPTTRSPGFISASRRRAGRASRPSTRGRWRMAGATTASPGVRKDYSPTITRPSSSIPTGIGSKPITKGSDRWGRSAPSS